MIVIDYLPLERHTDGREYVMVRLGTGNPAVVRAEWQMSKDEFNDEFICMFKPSLRMTKLRVNERTLEEW